MFIEGSILKDIGSYKDKVISALVNSHDICELMLNKETFTDDEAEHLIHRQIFPYLYADDTQDETLSYICLEADIPYIPTNTVKSVKLTVWVYCHKSIMGYAKNRYSGTRVDILSDMVERELRESNRFGIGKLKLESAIHFFPNNKFYGKELIYSMPDFKIGR